MKKLKENVHTIQVGCQLYGGAHLDKECPLNEEVKSVEEVKYGDFRCSSPFNNGPKYHVGPPGYYIHVDNRLPFGEKRPSLEELISKHLEESTQRRAEMEEWLIKEFHTKAASEVPNSSVGQCKAIYANDEAPINNTSSNGTNKLHGVSFISDADERVAQEEEDIGACVNVIPKSMFEHLKLVNLKKTDMLVEMADMIKRAHMGIVENILVKIDKFLFPSDFVGDNTNWWHDHGFEEDERQESSLDIEEYDLPKVHVETFEVNRYSFDSGYSFIYVTKEIEDTLPLGREKDQGLEK
ncbi:hypothetical protein Tco_0947283 [Tanacetum coccineum]